jgi:hypothetical protein
MFAGRRLYRAGEKFPGLHGRSKEISMRNFLFCFLEYQLDVQYVEK